MAEQISIKQRITRQLMRNLRKVHQDMLAAEVVASRLTQAEVDALGVHMADMRAFRTDQNDRSVAVTTTRNLKHLDIICDVDDESADEAGTSDSMFTDKTLPFMAGAILRLDESDTEQTQHVVDRWLAAMEFALLADPLVIEAGSAVRLANDVRLTATGRYRRITSEQAGSQRQVVPVVRIVVAYRHDRTSPYQASTYIPAMTE